MIRVYNKYTLEELRRFKQMAALSRTLLERTAEILNDDPFVKENTKRCKATLYLACENNKFALAFDNGKVRLLADGES